MRVAVGVLKGVAGVGADGEGETGREGGGEGGEGGGGEREGGSFYLVLGHFTCM